jgi:hypothetical protein
VLNNSLVDELAVCSESVRVVAVDARLLQRCQELSCLGTQHCLCSLCMYTMFEYPKESEYTDLKVCNFKYALTALLMKIKS